MDRGWEGLSGLKGFGSGVPPVCETLPWGEKGRITRGGGAQSRLASVPTDPLAGSRRVCAIGGELVGSTSEGRARIEPTAAKSLCVLQLDLHGIQEVVGSIPISSTNLNPNKDST